MGGRISMVNNDTNFKSIELLRCWCMKSLPTVFSDALSYNQQVCLLTKAINDMANTINGLPDYIIELVKELLNQLNLEEIVKEVLADLYFLNVKNPPNNMTAAVGDGVTDDTAAIQAMISYVEGKRAYLFFPAGVYSVTGIDVITNISLVGLDRYHTTLQLRAGSDRDLLIGELGNCTFSDITLDANMPGQTVNCSIFDGNTETMLIKNVIFKNGFNSINLDIGGSVHMSGIIFDGSQGNPLKISGTIYANDIVFINTSIINNDTLITINGNNSRITNFNCNTAIKTGVNISGNNCFIEGVITNAITTIINTGSGNKINILTTNSNYIENPSTSETISGNFDSTINGITNFDYHNDVNIACDSNIKTSSNVLWLEPTTPLKYGTVNTLSKYFNYIPMLDNNNNPYKILTATNDTHYLNVPVPEYFVNVKNLGVMGDGITDDTQAILTAYENYDNLYFPDGVYIIKQPIVLRSNTYLKFDGSIKLNLTDSLLIDSTPTKKFYSEYTCAISGQNIDNVTVEGLTLIGAYNPDWGFQGTPTWEGHKNNECIIFIINSTNIKLINTTISNYSGTGTGDSIHGSDTYPFTLKPAINPIKISSCPNTIISGFKWIDCSCEELLLFNSQNSIVTNLYSNSENVSCFGIWMSDKTLIDKFIIDSCTHGNAINVYSSSCIISNGIMCGSYSVSQSRNLMATLDVSNEGNVVTSGTFQTKCNNNNIENIVFIDGGLYLGNTTLSSEQICNEMNIRDCTFIYTTTSYMAGASALINSPVFITGNDYGKIIFDNCNCLDESLDSRTILLAGAVIESLIFKNCNFSVKGARFFDLMPITFKSGIVKQCGGTIIIENCDFNYNIGGRMYGPISFLVKNSSITCNAGINIIGITELNNTVEFINTEFTSVGDYSPGNNDNKCFFKIPSNANINSIKIIGCKIKSPTIIKLDLNSYVNGLLKEYIVKNNTFLQSGNVSRGYCSALATKINKIVYCNNTLESNSDGTGSLSLGNYDTLIFCNNIGVNVSCAISPNTATALLKAYAFNNVTKTLSCASNCETHNNRCSNNTNDNTINAQSNAKSVFDYYANNDIIISKNSVNSFMFPSGESNSTGFLILLPKSNGIMFMPRTSGKTFKTGFLRGNDIVWL